MKILKFKILPIILLIIIIFVFTMPYSAKAKIFFGGKIIKKYNPTGIGPDIVTIRTAKRDINTGKITYFNKNFYQGGVMIGLCFKGRHTLGWAFGKIIAFAICA